MSRKLDTNEFQMTMTLAKAYNSDAAESSSMFISGLASGTQVDHEYDVMAKSAIDSFKKAIEEGIVLPNGEWSQIPLRSGHRTEWNDILGWITKAEIDSDYNLWIEAELDSDSSDARDLFKKLTNPRPNGRPLQLGLSVGGKIREAVETWDPSLQKKVRVINGVMLREISVVGAPAYPPSYLEALTKSVVWQENEQKESLMDDKITTTDANEQVEKSAEVENAVLESSTETLEKSVDEKVSELYTLVSSLATSVQSIEKKLSESSSEEVVEKSEKVEEKTEEKPLEKSEEAAKSDAVPSLEDFTKALSTQMGTIVSELKTEILTKFDALSTKVDEFASTPMDKSVLIQKSKEEVVLSADEQLREMAKSTTRYFDPIGEALRIGIARSNNS